MTNTASKLTSKYQTTIPEPVRRKLKLTAGDTVVFEVDGDQVLLRKARPLDLQFTEAVEGTLTEWTTEADEEAFRDL